MSIVDLLLSYGNKGRVANNFFGQSSNKGQINELYSERGERNCDSDEIEDERYLDLQRPVERLDWGT